MGCVGTLGLVPYPAQPALRDEQRSVGKAGVVGVAGVDKGIAQQGVHRLEIIKGMRLQCNGYVNLAIMWFSHT